MIRLEVKPVTTGPAGGKSAVVVWSGKKQLGYIQTVSIDNPIQGGFCFPYLHIAQQQVAPYKHKLCDTFDDALKFFGIAYPQTEKIDYPSGIYDEFYKWRK